MVSLLAVARDIANLCQFSLKATLGRASLTHRVHPSNAALTRAVEIVAEANGFAVVKGIDVGAVIRLPSPPGS